MLSSVCPGGLGAMAWPFILSTGFIITEALNFIAVASPPVSPSRVPGVHTDFSEMKPLVFQCCPVTVTSVPGCPGLTPQRPRTPGVVVCTCNTFTRKEASGPTIQGHSVVHLKTEHT